MMNLPTCYHYPEDRSVSSSWSEPEDNVWPVNTAVQTWGPAPAATSVWQPFLSPATGDCPKLPSGAETDSWQTYWATNSICSLLICKVQSNPRYRLTFTLLTWQGVPRVKDCGCLFTFNRAQELASHPDYLVAIQLCSSVHHHQHQQHSHTNSQKHPAFGMKQL